MTTMTNPTLLAIATPAAPAARRRPTMGSWLDAAFVMADTTSEMATTGFGFVDTASYVCSKHVADGLGANPSHRSHRSLDPSP